MIKLITLNIEGNKHLDRVVDFLRTQEADVICLQEVFKVDLPIIEKATGLQAFFVPCAVVSGPNKGSFEPRGAWGLAWMTRLKHSAVQAAYYYGKGEIRPMSHNPNEAHRALIWSEVEKNGQMYRIATTHFTWTPDGQINAEQKRDFTVLSEMIKDFDSLVLCGDFNAPRGREMFTKFEQILIDHLPPDINSTLDPVLYQKATGLNLVVDTIFSTPNYRVVQVKTVSGVSDHQAVVGLVEYVHA